MEEDQLVEEKALVSAELVQSESKKLLCETRRLSAQESVQLLQGRLECFRLEMEEGRQVVTSLKVRVAALREKEESAKRAHLRVEALSADLMVRISSRSGELAGSAGERIRLLAAIASGEEALRTIVERQLASEQAQLLVKGRYDFEAAGVQTEESRLRVGRNEAASLRDLLSGRSLRLSEVAMTLSHLEVVLREKHRLEIAEALAAYGRLAWDEGEQGARQVELQKAIDEMGQVNLMAIEEFREMEERFSFLSG
jgi:chromosome segregation protein